MITIPIKLHLSEIYLLILKFKFYLTKWTKTLVTLFYPVNFCGGGRVWRPWIMKLAILHPKMSHNIYRHQYAHGIYFPKSICDHPNYLERANVHQTWIQIILQRKHLENMTVIPIQEEMMYAALQSAFADFDIKYSLTINQYPVLESTIWWWSLREGWLQLTSAQIS